MSRHIVISGTASGIGAATARLLTERGEHVIGIDRHDADVVADLSDPTGRAEAVAKATELADGVVDAVIACAGIGPDPKAVAVNYFGVTALLQGMLPALGRSEHPRAAVISSAAALLRHSPELVEAAIADDEPAALALSADLAAQGGLPLYWTYSSSKRALVRWIRRESVKAEWAGAGIPLNTVAPGTVLTPLVAPTLADPQTAAWLDGLCPMPLHGHMPPEAVANALIWLVSVENTHMAGQVVYVDGGADATIRGDDVWSWADDW